MTNPILTSDGSHTLFNEEVGEHYHSTFGAITESEHIFIRTGLGGVSKEKEVINVLEIGLGTGLNALLAIRWASKNNKIINYHAIEAYPLEASIINKLNYWKEVGVSQDLFMAIHETEHEKTWISDQFEFYVDYLLLEDANLPDGHFDVVFFDAFSPEVQAEMWTETSFKKIAMSMKDGGVLTTYSCKGTVKRALKAAGFTIEKLPGPPGKREFLRAQK